MKQPAQPHVLMISNNGTPTDRRIWHESTALRDAGYAVSVISPGRPDEPLRETIDGIAVYRYPSAARGGSPLRYAVHFARSWAAVLRLSWTVWRTRRFQLVQACNPPDTYFTIAALYRPFGVRFLFDQHDICPEIYTDRFEHPSRAVVALLLAAERLTHEVADHVITVNESCRRLLLGRTRTPRNRLTVVQTGADLTRLRLGAPEPERKRGRQYLCAYLGVMGPQDGVDVLLHAIRYLVYDLHREDVHFVLMGDGECLPDLRELARELEIEPWVEFTGWADDELISAVFSSSDVGLQPDRRTPFTDLCTMLKTIEYLAFGLPVVAFDLVESRRAAGKAAVFVSDESPASYARAVVDLLDDRERCARMCLHALWLSRTQLSWDRNRTRYLDVVRSLIGDPVGAVSSFTTAGSPADRSGPDGGPVHHHREGSHGH